MINVLNHFSGVHRKYVGSFNDKLRALAKKMSFQITNTTQFMDMPIGRLSYKGDDGSVSVSRHGDIEIIKGWLPSDRFFRFRITRDDGVFIDETLLRYYWQGITVYQKNEDSYSGYESVSVAGGRNPEYDPDDMQWWTKVGNVWHYYNDEDPDDIIQWTYNTVTHIWELWPYTWRTTLKGEYFVRFICWEDSITSWYKKSKNEDPLYVYKTADFYNDDDLIKPKFYEIAVPYYHVEATNDEERYEPPPEINPAGSWACKVNAYSGTINQIVNKTMTVSSSVDYTASFWADDESNIAYYGTFWPWSAYILECAWVQEQGTIQWLCRTENDEVLFTSNNGDSSQNPVDNPIASTKVISPPEKTVVTTVHTMTAEYTGGDPYHLVKECSHAYDPPIGTVSWDIPFMFMKVSFSMRSFVLTG